MACRSATAWRLVGLTTSATAMTPSSSPSAAKKSGVLPSSAMRSWIASRVAPRTPKASIMRRLPARQTLPSTLPWMPWPGICENSVTGRKGAPRRLASSTMARARGCSESASSEAAAVSSVSSETCACGARSVTTGWPWVMVPVLSSTTTCTSCAVSRASADLIRMPLLAPRPVPTMIAVGVARPSAHGQDTTSTDTAIVSANSNVAPHSSHTTAATTAMAITTGTNTPATLSASLAIGALELVASSTRRMIWASAVSSPTFSARILQ